MKREMGNGFGPLGVFAFAVADAGSVSASVDTGGLNGAEVRKIDAADMAGPPPSTFVIWADCARDRALL